MTVATAAAGSPPRVTARVAVDTAELDFRPSYLAAAIAGFVVFVLYMLTLAPTTSMWDTSEYITAAYASLIDDVIQRHRSPA